MSKAALMHVTVRFFAAHREATGTSSYAAEVPDGVCASDVWTMLQERFPKLERAASSVAFAVNLQQVPAGTALHEGDELALLPPMAGG